MIDSNCDEDAQIFEPLRRCLTGLAYRMLSSLTEAEELPDPIIDEAARAPVNEYADDLSVALLPTFERLSPLERAGFLLHDVFELDFVEVAQALDRSGAGAAGAHSGGWGRMCRSTVPA